MFVLITFDEVGRNKQYYTGKTYTHQKEYYPITTSEISHAKQYKTNKIAENSCKKLNEKVGIKLFDFKVEEIL